MPIWDRSIRTAPRRVRVAEGIRVLEGPFGLEEFVSTFVRSALEEDTRGLDMLPRLGDP